MFICICNAVTDSAIKEAVSNGAQTLDDLKTTLGVAASCGCCAQAACAYLEIKSCTGAKVLHGGANDHCSRERCVSVNVLEKAA